MDLEEEILAAMVAVAMIAAYGSFSFYFSAAVIPLVEIIVAVAAIRAANLLGRALTMFSWGTPLFIQSYFKRFLIYFDNASIRSFYGTNTF